MTSLLNTLIRIGQNLKTVNIQQMDIHLFFPVNQYLTNLNNKLQLLYIKPRQSI